MQEMDGVSVAEIARLIVVRDRELVGISERPDSQWRTDSFVSGIVVRERVYCPPGLVLIPLIVHGG